MLAIKEGRHETDLVMSVDLSSRGLFAGLVWLDASVYSGAGEEL